MNAKEEIPQFESETVEFKTSFGEAAEIIETIVAFANRKGGDIWIGISDKGAVTGATIGANTFENLTNQIKGRTSPPLTPEISQYTIDKKTVARIKVYESIARDINPITRSCHAIR